MKVVIDTNIWISYLLGKVSSHLDEYIVNESIKIITSEEQINELLCVINKSKFVKYFLKKDIEELLFLINKTCQLVKVKFKVNDCRDKKDNFILEVALSGDVDYIITEDKDLLVLDPYKNIRIIKYKDFLKLLE
jgi:hypothetical protein